VLLAPMGEVDMMDSLHMKRVLRQTGIDRAAGMHFRRNRARRQDGTCAS
jgi:hypothetical protein